MTVPEKLKLTAENIENILREKKLSAEILLCKNDVAIIHIEWGDWKHSHARLNYIMKEYFGATLLKEDVTESDGSDCYSAKHIFTTIDLNSNGKVKKS